MTVMATLTIALRDTETGDAAAYQMEYADDRLDGVRYMFREGNYSCDCNRSNFLAEALDGEYDTDLPCSGVKNRIAVDQIADENGRVLYRDER